MRNARFHSSLVAACAGLLCGLSPVELGAQQMTIGAPLRGVSSGFSENIGLGFGFNLRGGNPNGSGSRVVGLAPGGGGFALNPITARGDLQFRQGGAAGGANLGAAGLGGAGGVFFGLGASQTSSRTASSQTPMVTTLNGQPGVFSDTLQRPFVLGTVPVVGGAPMLGGIPQVPQPNLPPSISPLQQRMARYAQGETGSELRVAPPTPAKGAFAYKVAAARESSAGQPATSLAAIRAQHAAMDAQREAAADAELTALLERADSAQSAGRMGAAKVYLQMAIRRATGALQKDLALRLQQLDAR